MICVPFKVWLVMEKKEILASIKIPLPSVRQTTRYSCGAAALRAIFQYYGVGPEKEADFIDMMKSTQGDGTRPSDIVATARSYGLHVKQIHNLTIKDLKTILDQQRPVITPIQAWGTNRQYKRLSSGHYVIAIGYDEERIYFEDPVLKGNRGALSYEEFDERWHDKDAENNDYDHYGIIIWHDSEPRNSAYLLHGKKIS